MTIDLDPLDDPEGAVGVASVLLKGNVYTADLAFRVGSDTAPWQVVQNVDVTEAVIVPADLR